MGTWTHTHSFFNPPRILFGTLISAFRLPRGTGSWAEIRIDDDQPVPSADPPSPKGPPMSEAIDDGMTFNLDRDLHSDFDDANANGDNLFGKARALA